MSHIDCKFLQGLGVNIEPHDPGLNTYIISANSYWWLMELVRKAAIDKSSLQEAFDTIPKRAVYDGDYKGE